MQARKYLLLFFLGISALAGAQVNRYGIPFQRNYSTAKLSYAEQNWAVAQDSRGVMYFGNNDNGVIEFDGVNWRAIPLPNSINVRSLAIDSMDRIFVGGVNEFGVILPDKKGNLVYNSLSARLDSADQIRDLILKTHVVNNRVYFCGSSKIGIYDYHTVKTVSILSNSFLTFNINGTLYVGNNTKGLMKFSGDSLIPIKGGEYFASKAITALIPVPGNDFLITTAFDGLFYFNSQTGESRKTTFTPWIEKVFKDNIPYDGTLLGNDKYAIATLGNGLMVLNRKGEAVDQLSKAATTLYDDQVTSVFYNPQSGIQSPIWLSLNSGLARAELNSPFRFFGEESGIKGQVADIIRYKGILYIATSSGVYYLDYPLGKPPVFKPIEKLSNFQAWRFLKFRVPGSNQEKLFIATFQGIWELIGKEDARDIAPGEEEPVNAIPLVQSRISPNRMIVGSFGVELFTLQNGSWTHKKIKGINEEIRSIQEDNDGNIWLGTYLNGVIRLQIKSADTTIKYYDVKDGLPSLRDIHVFLYENKLIFSTTDGLYNYDKVSDRFSPDSSFGKRYSDGSRGIFQMLNPGPGVYWFLCYRSTATTSWIEKASRGKNGEWVYETQLFKRLPSSWSDVIYVEEEGLLWAGMSSTLYSFNPAVAYRYDKPFSALIRSVTIGEDSTIFNGAFREGDSLHAITVNRQPADMTPTLSYRLNNMSFHFAAPFFENEDAIEYSYFLEGLSSNWSKWSGESKIPFNNLGEGTYTFRVKARNVYGVESSEAAYSFKILPPWYRTIIAYILYVILLGVFIWAVVKYNTRRLQLEKIHLEKLVQERTAEVVKQKEEIEAQRDEIIAQKKDITDSIRYASRIQQAVLPSEKMMNDELPDHFILFKPRDIVSGDFYWMTQRDEKIFLVVADCTGHGVPGAFMSMLGMSFLNEIVNKSSIEQANLILNELREHVIAQLKQTGREEGETKDGMDLSLMIIDKKNKKIQFAGANNPLYLIRPLTVEEMANPVAEDDLPRGNLRNEKYELVQINADKMPIGISAHLGKSFTNTEIDLHSGIALYISSDGYEDQFGGPNGKKFLSKSLKRLLLKIQGKPMAEQKKVLDNTIEEWRGDLDQVDDILMMGVMLT
jgi:serine phosphatase RsbU (regulator of sigma subunit)/ligand-binding sensor domain-containing protein